MLQLRLLTQKEGALNAEAPRTMSTCKPQTGKPLNPRPHRFIFVPKIGFKPYILNSPKLILYRGPKIIFNRAWGYSVLYSS